MDKYKFKFTRLQNEIFRVLSINTGENFNQREIARILRVSPTAIAKAVLSLEREDLIKVEKDKKINLVNIYFNRDSEKAINLKRVDNLKLIYESELVNFFEIEFAGAVIILFGSYSYGEDTINSDIDIAIVGRKEKLVNVEKFEKIFEKEIRINFYDDFTKIHKNLRSNIFNGIILSGRIDL